MTELATSFTSWDENLQRFDPNSLEHHGIPGMKWGVRKYQNKDGSLTPKGQQRYGNNKNTGKISTSARKMQRDFNNLDKGYANVYAENSANYSRLGRIAKKGMKYTQKMLKKGANSSTLASSKKLKKIKDRMTTANDKIKMTERQLKSIEALQWKILGKAKQAGYTASTKGVIRQGYTRKARGMANAAGLLVGGALGGAAAGAALGASGKMVAGSKAKIRKKGDGSLKISPYTGANVSNRTSKNEALGREAAKEMEKVRKRRHSKG